jgi:hypothetical protein
MSGVFFRKFEETTPMEITPIQPPGFESGEELNSQ